MKAIVLGFLLLGCGGHLESMAWRVDCATDTPQSLYDRWIEESPNYCDANNDAYGANGSYDMCSDWYVKRYRYEWAKADYRARCERPV